MRHSLIKYTLVATGIAGLMAEAVVGQPPVNAPSPTDRPEEISGNQVITGGRSPIDARPLTASEYVTLQTQLQTQPTQPEQVSQKVRDLIGLLKIRKFIKTLMPFLPVK